MTGKPPITNQELQNLLMDPSAPNKAEISKKIASQYKEEHLSPEEKTMAEEILTTVIRAMELEVKHAVVEQLQDYPGLNPALAKKIIADVDALAIPILKYSDALTDTDLLEQVSSCNHERQKAIAERKQLSALVSAALVQYGNRDVVATLTSNPGADFTENSLQQILDKYPTDTVIKEHLVYRKDLPASLAERLVTMVTSRMQEYLLANYEINAEVSEQILRQSREKTTIKILKGGLPFHQIQKLVTQLHTTDRLTDTLIVRALCSGDLRFFECAIAARLDVPPTNIQQILATANTQNLTLLCEKAHIDKKYWSLLENALEVCFDPSIRNDIDDMEVFSRRVMERVLTALPDIDAINIDQLLVKLNEYSAESITRS